jgi:acetoin utilization protein AcuB
MPLVPDFLNFLKLKSQTMEIKKRMVKKIQIVKPGDSLARAFDLLSKSDSRLLPVVEKDQVVGILSYRDSVYYLLKTGKRTTAPKDWETTPVAEVMTKEVKTVSPQTDCREAAEIMSAHKISGLPVVEKGSLVGVITETTILEEYIAQAK